MFKTDLEIAQECKMEHIRDIAAKIGVGEEDLEYYGRYPLICCIEMKIKRMES